MPFDRRTETPRGHSIRKTAIACLALAVAVGILTTTLTPSEHVDTTQIAADKTCTRLCQFSLHGTDVSEPSGNLEITTAAKSSSAPNKTTVAAHEATKANVAQASKVPAATPKTATPVPLKIAGPAAEPITTRPVADRFAFINSAIGSMMADLEIGNSKNRFASLTASELKPVTPAQLSELQLVDRELAALPPETTLSASPLRVNKGLTNAPQVAGWRLIRTVTTEELSQEAALKGFVLPIAPTKKPDVPSSYETRAKSKVPQRKKSKRTRSQTNLSSASKKAKPAAAKKPKAPSWETNALFRDN